MYIKRGKKEIIHVILDFKKLMDGDNYFGIGTYLHGVSNTVHFNYNFKGEKYFLLFIE